MNEWKFVRDDFNWGPSDEQIGSIITPDGQYFAAVEYGCALPESDQALIDRVVAVLNRELPNGKPRKRKAKVSK